MSIGKKHPRELKAVHIYMPKDDWELLQLLYPRARASAVVRKLVHDHLVSRMAQPQKEELADE